MGDNEVKVSNGDKNEEKQVNEETDLNNQILNWAENGHILGVSKCLSFDRNLVNAVDSDGYTPLHRASYNNHLEVAKLLIKSGANVRSRTYDGWQPLHSATKWGHVQIIDLLLNCGADINAATSGGNTALHLAASNPGSKKVLEFLLFHEDVDISLKNDSGDTAYDIAKRSSSLYTLWDYL